MNTTQAQLVRWGQAIREQESALGRARAALATREIDRPAALLAITDGVAHALDADEQARALRRMLRDAAAAAREE